MNKWKKRYNELIDHTLAIQENELLKVIISDKNKKLQEEHDLHKKFRCESNEHVERIQYLEKELKCQLDLGFQRMQELQIAESKVSSLTEENQSLHSNIGFLQKNIASLMRERKPYTK